MKASAANIETAGRMTPTEKKASISLAGIFALRMLGLFLILPVFAVYAKHLPGGENDFLVGLTLGIYGLTQSMLQIPFGAASDRLGRRPVIAAGLLLFAAGSILAAVGTSIWTVLLGRALQGAGLRPYCRLALSGLCFESFPSLRKSRPPKPPSSNINPGPALSLTRSFFA